MNIIVPGIAQQQDPMKEVFDFIGGPLHGSKFPIHPKARKQEVGLNIGGKMAIYRPKIEKGKLVFHFSELA